MTFVQQDKTLHDTKFETKPVSYLRGCWRRFRRNKGSIVAGIILLFVLSFAIFAPLGSDRTVSWNDANFSFVTPKSPLFEGTGFWDGTQEKKIYQNEYDQYRFYETETKPVVKVIETGMDKATEQDPDTGKMISVDVPYYKIRLDTYAIGAKIGSASVADLEKIRAWEEKTGRKILLPIISAEAYLDEYFDAMIAAGKTTASIAFTQRKNLENKYGDSNIYYKLVLEEDAYGKLTRNPVIDFDAEGNVKDLYKRDGEGKLVYYDHTDADGVNFRIRVDYNNYYEYKYGAKCHYLFGSNANGFDIFVRLASGARLSLLLGVGVSLINLFIGLIYGSISGYYGGTVDLVMERITDILSAIPFVIVATLFQLHFAASAGPVLSLLFAFVLTGWIGTAATTRMQFYRFKDQEYVLASRTLGAKDLRLIFVDILPNALGTLITSSVLMIPGVIFSESSLSYLNIIDLSNSDITSVGTLLNEGSNFLSTNPHIIMFPAIFISILMITFNLIGNGLRDAFNPSLRGEE